MGEKMNLKLEELRKSLFTRSPEPANAAPMPQVAFLSQMHDSRASDSGAPKWVESLVPNGGQKVSVEGAEVQSSTPGEAGTAPLSQARLGTSSMNSDSAQPQPSTAIAGVFEETRYFEQRLADLHEIFNYVEEMSGAADELFASLHSFGGRLSQLAQSFAPMRAFQLQLAQMAETFEPMKLLRDQLAQVGDAFENHLGLLLDALNPALQIRERVLRMAHTFDQVEQLQVEFGELLSVFRAAASDTRAHI
jgi:hypothetical protein